MKHSKSLFLSALIVTALCNLDYTNQSSWDGNCNVNTGRQSPIDIPCQDFIVKCPSNIKYQVHWDNPITTFGGSTYEDLKTYFTNKNIWVLFTNSTNSYLFKSAQFHFHHTSEHAVNGHYYDMEMHIVHLLEHPSITQYLVLGVFFEVDQTLTYDFIDYVKFNSNTSFTHLFPFPVTNKPAYHYLGSLTTPPCTEAVNWFVQLEPIKITKEHFDQLKTEVGEGHPNNRQVQALNSRPVYLVGQGC